MSGLLTATKKIQRVFLSSGAEEKNPVDAIFVCVMTLQTHTNSKNPADFLGSKSDAKVFFRYRLDLFYSAGFGKSSRFPGDAKAPLSSGAEEKNPVDAINFCMCDDTANTYEQ
jgi:hypothetical protein